MSVTKVVTAEALMAMGPETGYELIEGELVEVSPSGLTSSELAANLIQILGPYIRQHRLGRLSTEGGGYIVARNPDTVLAPDVGFFRLERAPERLPAGVFAPFPPDLAVEIMSASDRSLELTRKAERYLRAGTKLVWVIDPAEETVTVFRGGRPELELIGEDVISGEDVLPGFELAVVDVFRDPMGMTANSDRLLP